ncbi:CHASE2 domain-containing protein [Nitrospira tepida]|uniref:CHASE2 domain-containing protein n=2 Tax=Nitrospira tepida TaxID=2973512 RepID=A0AA86T7T2_9BACT|nr:CHASE2 domain-containing protein [Nitrospira tepida]
MALGQTAADFLARRTRSSRLIQAAVIGGLSAILSTGLFSAGGSVTTLLDRALYDWWATRQAPPAVESIVIVGSGNETQATEAGLRREQIARMVDALEQAGARAIGLLDPLTTPSSPEQGGAAGDTLLAELIAQSGRVVIPLALIQSGPQSQSQGDQESGANLTHRQWLSVVDPRYSGAPETLLLSPPFGSLLEASANAGHQIVSPERDGTVRQIPLFVRLNDRLVPAFGLAAFMTASDLSASDLTFRSGSSLRIRGTGSVASTAQDLVLPLDKTEQLMVPALLTPLPSSANLIRPEELWRLIEAKEFDQLRTRFANRIVLLDNRDREKAAWRINRPPLTDYHVLASLLIGRWARPASRPVAIVVSWLLPALATWLFLTWKPGRATIGIVLTIPAYLGLVFGSLSISHLVLPLFIPLCGLLLATAGTLLWKQAAAGVQIRVLEQDVQRVQAHLTAVREAVASQESLVERLKEDLEAAQAGMAESAMKARSLESSAQQMQRAIEEATAKEIEARRRLIELEADLAGLRAASVPDDCLPQADLEVLREECRQFGILSRNETVLKVFREVKKAARTPIPILILGESGTGKELFARAIHLLSPRASQPFVAVNMAAISPELFESELFGHVRGSFSGATQDRPGYFELANRGTLFLDEIGDLRPDHQGKLLRALQERTFYRVGATKLSTVDVRVIAATNRDLTQGVTEGWFRPDLYARLRGLVVTLPPLRDRREDIPLLAEHVLKKAAAAMAKPALKFSEEALKALQDHAWPHNVRELQQCIEQAVALTDRSLLGVDDLRLALPFPPRSARSGGDSASIPDVTGDRAVLACLRNHRFDMQATARALGWDRSTVTQRLKGLCFQALAETGGDKTLAATSLAQDPALVRTVELKLIEYTDHLFQVARNYPSTSEAIEACRKRFKNLPDRHFKAVEVLIRREFDQLGRASRLPSQTK